MPPLETDDLFEPAVYMAKSGVGRYGQVVRSAPVQIQVRWEWERRELTQADGTVVVTDAWAAVDREMQSGDTLWLGELLNWLGTGSGLEEDTNEVCEVVYYAEIPDLKNRHRRREVGLRRYMGARAEVG